MPKAIQIDPTAARSPGTLTGPAIPLNAYVSDPTAELARYGADTLVQVYADMLLIRAFETMLDSIKKTGAYQGVAYQHKGPAHLSIGQEAAAVGQALALGADDQIFGSHRSHGEILAKGLRASRTLAPDQLDRIMTAYLGGSIFRVAETLPHADARELAENFLLYGTLAEIFGKRTGFNQGLGGSMHAFFPPFGIMPNNAIVGGSAGIAVGAALFKRVNARPGIVIANIGDASLSCGPVWEALNFAAMDQFHTLWDPAVGGHPPVLFSVMNNFYGMGGQPAGETMGFGALVRVALGVNEHAMHAERVDGLNPLAVADAVTRKRGVLERGHGPVLLDVVTYRFSGHSPSDASSYRDQAELAAWQAQDGVQQYRDYLLKNSLATAATLDGLEADATQRVTAVLRAAIDPQRSPRFTSADAIAGLLHSGADAPRLADGDPAVLLPFDQTRISQTRAKFRFALDDAGQPHSRLKTLTYAEALTEALLAAAYTDPTLVLFGEENRDWGGAFGVYRGLTEALPYHRLFNSPISEAAIVASGVGYALAGGRAVVELMYADFIGRAGDEIFNQMAKWQAMSGGALRLPLTLRVSVGSKYGAQHSQDWSSLVAHIPGLYVFYPATPYDAKGMLALALRGTDPVVFFESQRLYAEPERLVAGGVPIEDYTVQLGQPAVRRTGADLTLITIGPSLYTALAAAELLAAEGLETEVIDIRFLVPLDLAPLVESVRKTGRAAIVTEASGRGAFAHTLATQISAAAFDDLDGPVLVIAAQDSITPPAELEDLFFPQPETIVAAVRAGLLPKL